MDNRPELRGRCQLCRKLWLPIVRRSRPRARFAIVGRIPTSGRSPAWEGDGAHVTGAVADVRSWLSAADRGGTLAHARGVQNKLLEALAMARPVVHRRAAFEGIDAEAGSDLLVADGDKAQPKP